jgi:uncharacterized membrane protein YccC
MGALAAGFASQQGVYRTRAAAMIWTVAAMALSTFVGAFVGHWLGALIAATALWGYAYGIIASLGPAATTVGINSVIALIVFSHYPVDAPHALIEAILVFAGGLVQTFLLVSVWPLRRFSAERHALASAARSLAQYARDTARGTPGLPATQPLANVRDTLADPQPFAHRGDIAVFQSLLDELQRVRGSLAALATDRVRASNTDALDELALATAAILSGLADALDAAREPIDPSGEWARLQEADQRLETLSASEKHVRSDAHALAGQLRSLWRIATLPADLPEQELPQRRVPMIAFPSLEDTLATLQANMSQHSPFGRLAPRVAVTLGIATILGGVVPTAHGYWMPMTAVILLRPDFSQTALRGIARVVGTLIGAAFATALAAHVRPGSETYVACCILFAGLGYYVFKANYALFTVAITSYVAFALALLGQTETTAVRDRVLATVIAGVLVGIAVYVWPTWEGERVRAALADLIEAQRSYLRAILGAYIDPKRYDQAAIGAAQRNSWSLRANAEASVDRMLGEPARQHAISHECALGILAASRRVGLSSLSLNVHFARSVRMERPGLAEFARALDEQLGDAARTLRGDSAADEPGHLRETYRIAQEQLRSTQDPNAEMILATGDALVDAVNTLSELARSAVYA